jgi:hypothetical protein
MYSKHFKKINIFILALIAFEFLTKIFSITPYLSMRFMGVLLFILLVLVIYAPKLYAHYLKKQLGPQEMQLYFLVRLAAVVSISYWYIRILGMPTLVVASIYFLLLINSLMSIKNRDLGAEND